MAARRFVEPMSCFPRSADIPAKPPNDRATALLAADDLALSAQVLQEFHVQATRASRADALPHDLAAGLIRAWARFPVQEISLGIVTAALEVHAKHGFSYWDSAIVAAAQALGCHELLSEDMADGQRIGGLRVVNPFR